MICWWEYKRVPNTVHKRINYYIYLLVSDRIEDLKNKSAFIFDGIWQTNFERNIKQQAALRCCVSEFPAELLKHTLLFFYQKHEQFLQKHAQKLLLKQRFVSRNFILHLSRGSTRNISTCSCYLTFWSVFSVMYTFSRNFRRVEMLLFFDISLAFLFFLFFFFKNYERRSLELQQNTIVYI